MSDYFDGLMRSSGLPLGHAPVIGPLLRGAAPMTAIDVEVPADAPMLDPPDVTARATQQMFGASLVPSASPVPSAAARVSTAASANTARNMPPSAAPTSASTEPAPKFDEARTAPAYAPSASAFAPSIADSATAPMMARERILQAAMRWVAAEPAQPPTEAVAAPDIAPAVSVEKSPAEPPALVPIVSRPDPSLSPPARNTTARWVEPPPVPPPATQEARPPSRAVAAPMPRETPPTREEPIQVSIGSIHLQVEAPAPPALRTTPVPRAPAVPPTTPRSGLSRRALRGI
jgi:hypothetical protein